MTSVLFCHQIVLQVSAVSRHLYILYTYKFVDVLANVILLGISFCSSVPKFISSIFFQHLELLKLEVAPFMDITTPGITQMVFLRAPLLQCCGPTSINQCICMATLPCHLICGTLVLILWSNITWVQLQAMLVVLQMYIPFIQDHLKKQGFLVALNSIHQISLYLHLPDEITGRPCSPL